MNQSILEMTRDLVRAQIEQGFVSAERLQETLREIHYSLLALKVMEDRNETGELGAGRNAERMPGASDWRKSITKHAVTCLECGESFKQLSIRHLTHHGLDVQTYREKYGIPRAQPLSARETTARRREVAKEIQPWAKTPTYLKSQQGQAMMAKATTSAKETPSRKKSAARAS